MVVEEIKLSGTWQKFVNKFEPEQFKYVKAPQYHPYCVKSFLLASLAKAAAVLHAVVPELS